MNINWPSKHQWAVLGTHAVVGASGVIATAAFMGALNPGQVQEATGDVSRIVADLKDLYGSVASLIGIGVGAYAFFKSSPLISFIRAAIDINADPKRVAQVQNASLPEKAAVVAITDKIPEVAGVGTSNTPAGKALATAVPSNTVQVAKT